MYAQNLENFESIEGVARNIMHLYINNTIAFVIRCHASALWMYCSVRYLHFLRLIG